MSGTVSGQRWPTALIVGTWSHIVGFLMHDSAVTVSISGLANRGERFRRPLERGRVDVEEREPSSLSGAWSAAAWPSPVPLR